MRDGIGGKMEKKRMLLQDHYEDIVKDLDIIYIIDDLFTNKAINGNEYDNIKGIAEQNRLDGTRALLNILQNGSMKAIDAFVDSLAKDYDWLYEKLNVDNNMNDSSIDKSYEDSLSRGDVPRFPPYYVQRKELEEEVASKLKELDRHKVLVLLGMAGSGKSTVAIGALRNNREVIRTNGVLFWLNMGNVKTDDDISALQIKLYRKTSQYRRRESFMSSSLSMLSITSSLDSQSLNSTGYCWIDLRDKLKTVFEEGDLKDCLLILDEVGQKRFVDAFDIGCKMLITTRDRDVVANLQPQIIRISSTFNEDETLQLFASCLGVSQLPYRAKEKKLLAICKGLSPFHLALIGAQFAENSERLLNDRHRWDYYINKLSKKDYFNFSTGPCGPMKAIEMCINSLSPDILPLFKKLAVLPDNVKVSTRVLKVLWGEDISTVEKVMKALWHKSLVNETYDYEHKNYFYDIHDLIQNYLKECQSKDDIFKYHAQFLQNYGFYNVDNLPVELPDDGYIAFYIGYHLDNSRASKMTGIIFNKLFLNLKFLGNKVRLTGAADVIMDLEKYSKSICVDKVDEELVINIRDFLNKHGNDLYRYPDTDIVQSILQYENKGVLFQRAYQVAQDDCQKNQLYFEFLHERNVDDTEIIQHLKDKHVKQDLTSICFLNDFILVGTKQGTIMIYDITTTKLIKELTNSSHAFKCVAACPHRVEKVAALNEVGEMHLWFLGDLDFDENVIEEELADRILEYDCESNLSDYVCITPPEGSPFLNFSWGDDKLITHTSNKVIIYDYRPDQTDLLKVEKVDEWICDKDVKLKCCILSHDDKIMIIAYQMKDCYYVDIRNRKNKKALTTFREYGPILNVICVPAHVNTAHCVLVVTETMVRSHEWNMFNNEFKNYKGETVISTNQVKENVKFISAVVNKSGTNLFVSTNDSRVICLDLNNKEFIDIDNKRGDVISMAVSEMVQEFTSYDVLVTVTGNLENSVKFYCFNTVFVSQATKKHRKVRLTSRFDVSFTSLSGCYTPPSDQQSMSSTPKRHQSFMTVREQKPVAKKTLSLDRHSLKSLNLKGISNGNDECGLQPLLAVIDDRNHIQVLHGHELLKEITPKPDCEVTVVRISPCNQYIVYGLHTGTVNRFTIRTKETKVLMDVNSRIHYLDYVNANSLVVFGKNRRMMVHRLRPDGEWELRMLQKGNTLLGSQEILNDIQGNKKKCGSISSSESETSLTSRDQLSNGSCLIQCFWVEGVGMLSIEDNATVKLWNEELQLVTVLNGRQYDVMINCATYQNRILVICDDYGKFQTFELRTNESTYSLHTIQDKNNKLNNKITCCSLTKDGKILAMGLDSGSIVLWNVPNKIQLAFLKNNKGGPVQACVFSPVPQRMSKSTAQSPTMNNTFHFPNNNDQGIEEETPLVLVTMASEILWWNVTYLMKISNKKPNLRNRGRNVLLSPLATPLDNRTSLTASIDNLDLNNSNSFFGNGYLKFDSFENLWRSKTYKDGSKGKGKLSCIKISGMNAKKICVDEKFSCFVTVDNLGHIHIMNVMNKS